MKNQFNYILVILLAVSLNISAQHHNQVGYLPSSVKRIFLSEEFAQKDFSVIDAKGKQMFAGTASIAKYWEPSGTKVCIADFTAVVKEGKYFIKEDEIKEEIEVNISNNHYQKLGKSVSRMFYHARASMPIDEKYAGKFARLAGHPDDIVLVHASAASTERPEGYVISSPGGWYDAGDYNKYIVNSAISTYTLLHAVEMYTKQLKDIELNIPESGNNVPDLLDEALYNLQWMLTMQDPNDGGVYHKLTSNRFCAMLMPHKDKLPRYVVMKSTAATLGFAATMAKASRILISYENEFPGLSDKCKEAAVTAWKWSVANPSILYQQPKDIFTGQYGDDKLADEWLWATAELYITTGQKQYADNIDFKSVSFGIPSWGSVATLSLYSILNAEVDNKELKDSASKQLLKLADKFYSNYNESAYKVSINKFPWGSNGVIANQGMMFLNAYQQSAEKKYLEAADACLGYILGANPTGYCFVTGFGNKSPIHIHERRSESDGIEEPLPGFIVGGPTLQAQKDCGKDNYPSQFPARAYLDKECSYSTNEIAINWNAPFCYLVFGVSNELNK